MLSSGDSSEVEESSASWPLVLRLVSPRFWEMMVAGRCLGRLCGRGMSVRESWHWAQGRLANRLFFPWVPKLDTQPGLFFSGSPNVHLDAMDCQHTLTWVCPFLLPLLLPSPTDSWDHHLLGTLLAASAPLSWLMKSLGTGCHLCFSLLTMGGRAPVSWRHLEVTH